MRWVSNQTEVPHVLCPTRKKITVCEHCGRILVDADMEALVAG